MEAVDLHRPDEDRRRNGALRAASGMPRRSNEILAILLVGITVLAPLPLASNRPQLWTIWSCLIGLIAAGYFVHSMVRNRNLRFSLTQLALPALIFGAFCLWLLLQVLPLPISVFSLGQLQSNASEFQAISLNRNATLLMLIRWISYGLFFFLFLQVAVNRSRAHSILQVLFATVSGYALLGLFMLTQWNDTLLGTEKWAYQGFATSTFVNRNSFATFLAMALPAGIVLLFHRLQGHETLPAKMTSVALVVAGTLIIAATLFATGSRMGTFAGIAATVFVLLVCTLRAGLPWWVKAAIMSAVGAMLVVFLVTFGENLIDRLIFGELGRETRWIVFSQTLGAIAQRPWTGYGGGSFEWVFPFFGLPPLSPEFMWNKAHSTYLQLWFELGLVVGSLPLILCAMFAFRAIRASVWSRRDWYVPLAGLGALLVAALHSTVDFSLEIPANAYLLLAFLGCAVSASINNVDRAHAAGAGQAP